MPACDSGLVRADQRGIPCAKLKTMAAREAHETGGKAGAASVRHENIRPKSEATRGRRAARCDAAKKAGGLVNNNENTSARPRAMRQERGPERSARLESLAKATRRSRCGAAKAANEVKISTAGSSEDQARTRSHGIEPRRPIVNARKSLLIPRRHLGAAGGAAVFAFGAGRFLPLAGPVGSSCAYTGSGSNLSASPGSRAPTAGRGATGTVCGS